MCRVNRRVTLLIFVCTTAVGLPCMGDDKSDSKLDAARLIGKAYYENDKFDEAAAEFRRCIELAPQSAVDYFNLGLVLMRAQHHGQALQALNHAARLDPNLLAVHYAKGIIYKRELRFQESIDSLQLVVTSDPQCPGAHYNMGVCYKYLNRFEEAIQAFKKTVELSPANPSSHYQLITLYRRLGMVDDAQRHIEIFERVKNTVDESEKTVEALERSKYTYIIEGARITADLEPGLDGDTRFVDSSVDAGLGSHGQRILPPPPLPHVLHRVDYNEGLVRDQYVPSVGAAVVLSDYDGDGDLDIYVVNCTPRIGKAPNQLWRNLGHGKFENATAHAGVGDTGLGMDAVFGDYDNDGDTDLYVVNYGPNVLYRNNGDGTFEDVSAEARANEPHFGRKAVFVDYDHDNDLDLFIINDADPSEPPDADHFSFPGDFPGQTNTLLRNNGNGTFSDQTDEAGLLVAFNQSRDVTFADFDGDQDTDLLVVNADAPPTFFSNARLGKFSIGGSFSPSIAGGCTAVADGDFNRDGHIDLIIAVDKTLYLYTNDGKANFTGTPVTLPEAMRKDGVQRISVCDYNNDGWSDLLLVSTHGRFLGLLTGAGKNKFQDATTAPWLDGSSSFVDLAGIATADVDGDGDQDIFAHERIWTVPGRHKRPWGTTMLRNDSPPSTHWIDVRLVGKKVNRSGVGATVEIAAGGHYQKQVYRSGPVHFGLGDLQAVDVVRVTWPNGVAQNVIRPDINRELLIEEFVKVSASCAFLYSFNGRGFELVNEILGIGPLGVPMAPGIYHQPDCTELTKIDGRQLVARNGVYQLRLTEELREIAYLDQATLRVVDHPSGLEIIPNEYFTAPPFPEDKFFAIGRHRPPRSARDHRGNDVLDLVLRSDGRFPTFPMTAYDGLAKQHSLTLDLGDLGGAEHISLFLDGWIYWAESSVVMAIAQDPRFEMTPLKLEVTDEAGNWQTAIESVGLPTSKGAVVPVDLTGRFLCDDYRIRLSTNMCVYFDRIFISTGPDYASRCRQTELPVSRADLHYRGFSRMTRDANGYERFDYTDVTPTGSWNPPEGMFTRYGEVAPLLARPDDMYVIFGPGDELTMFFDAANLPALPAGWTRDFIFYANGWVKDGDLNSKFSETVTPLPFHGMSAYPYSASQGYPTTPEHKRYLELYNTRPSRPTVGRLVLDDG